jgi:hypothetical protein
MLARSFPQLIYVAMPLSIRDGSRCRRKKMAGNGAGHK